MRDIVGIIGGAGVAATNKLLEIIEMRLTKNGAFRDAHHPEMIIYQATQAPSRSMFLEGKGESFINDYIIVGKKLKSVGATKIAMCCNTAHFAIDEIATGIGCGVVNLIERVVLEAKATKQKQFGLIASDGCLKGKVYEKYFEKHYPEAKIIYPDEETQKLVTKGICNIKNASRFHKENDPERPLMIFTEVAGRLRKAGAEKIIVGCTDIRVDYFDFDNIDSLEMLASCILEHSV